MITWAGTGSQTECFLTEMISFIYEQLITCAHCSPDPGYQRERECEGNPEKEVWWEIRPWQPQIF